MRSKPPLKTSDAQAARELRAYIKSLERKEPKPSEGPRLPSPNEK